MWGNNTLFGAIAAFMIFGPVEWFDWKYGFFIAAAIYFAGFLVSLMIPGKPREPEAVPAQDSPSEPVEVQEPEAVPAPA
jgi:hypothetical protein